MSSETLSSLDNAVKRLVDREAAISLADRQKASTTQNHLRQILRAKSARDPQFPFLLEKCDEDFLGGSFARHTKIWPLDDIDLYVPLDGAQLVYSENGQRLPFVASSDNHLRANRLTSCQKWMSGSFIDPTKLLQGIRAAVDDSYSVSATKLHAQAVNLQLSVASNTQSDGISLDIVPCFHMIPHDTSEPFYLMPNGKSSWVRTNPRKDNDLSVSLHTYHNHTYRKAIRLVKYWNATLMGKAFSSYYLKLAICKKFDSYRDNRIQISSNTIALYRAFEAVRDSYAVGNLSSLVVGAPTIDRPILGVAQRERLGGIVGLIGSAYASAVTHSNLSDALAAMGKALGTWVE
jgi:hypothetical protein